MNKTRVLQVFQARLARLPVSKHPALLFNPWVEGYKDYTFGGKAGPSIQTVNIFHELAHAAQFGGESFRTRASFGRFVFKVKRRFVYDRYCVESQTSQGTERELDTFAHQMHLMEAAGIAVHRDRQSEYFASIMKYMHDWYMVPGEKDEDRLAWMQNRILTKFDELSRAEVMDKLEGWLDKTQKRLNRQKLVPLQTELLKLRPYASPIMPHMTRL